MLDVGCWDVEWVLSWALMRCVRGGLGLSMAGSKCLSVCGEGRLWCSGQMVRMVAVSVFLRVESGGGVSWFQLSYVLRHCGGMESHDAVCLDCRPRQMN